MVTKSVGLIVLGVMLIAAIPVAVCAQGMLGDPSHGFPPGAVAGVPGGFPGGNCMPPPSMGMSGPPSPANFCPPPCPPLMQGCKPPAVFEPSVYVGYVFKKKGAGVLLKGNGSNALAGVHQFRLDHDIEGVWIEGISPIRINDRMGLAIAGSYFFPSTNRKATAVYRFDPALATSAATRKWHADIQWYTLQGALSFNLFQSCSPYTKLYCPPDCMPPNPCPPGPSSLAALTILGGLRWDAFKTSLDKPGSVTGALPSLATDQADVSYSAILPFVGAVAQRAGCNGMFKVGMLGFPSLVALASDFDYGETVGDAFGAGTTARITATEYPRSGYFFEAFGEAAIKIGNGHLGAFVKYFNLHARNHVDLRLRELSGAVAPATSDFILSVDRRNWTFGGRLSFLFSTGL
ncbi:MAG: hypothetical protein AB1646_16860 [Thermodesulfobacteriota bacterium]